MMIFGHYSNHICFSYALIFIFIDRACVLTKSKTTTKEEQHQMKYRAFDQIAIVRRGLLYIAVNFFAISLVWFWFTGTLPSSGEMITSCALNENIYCGRVVRYGWRGIRLVEAAECLVVNGLPAEIDTVTAFCDPDRKVSRFVVITIVTQALSVLLWAVIWIVIELICLQLPTGRVRLGASSKMTVQGCVDIDKSNLLRSNSWLSSLASYHEKRGLREVANNLEVSRKWKQSANVVLHYILCSFGSMGISCWIWGLGMYSIATKYLLLKGMLIFLRIGGDPNLVAKSINAFKKSGREKNDKDVEVGMQESEILWNRSTCLLIACHLSTTTPTEATQLRATLNAALLHFPANHIFVCDNANELQPPDNTQYVVMDVHPDINYLYIPVGNKSFAFYWTEKYWLPHLQMNRLLPKSAMRYLVTIDDDVCLPANFYVHLSHLDEDNQIAAVQYQVVPMINSAGRGVNRPLLTGLQYMEYTALGNVPEPVAPMPENVASLTGMLKWCSPLYCSGALAVWRREDFNDIMRNHDSVFHGEDLQMGLLLIGKGDKKRMIACCDQNCVIPTVAPSCLGDFLRQRIKSWELINHVWKTDFFLTGFGKSVLRACKGHQTSAKASVSTLS